MNVEFVGPWAVENVNPRVHSPQVVWDLRSFMIAGHDENRNARVGDTHHRLHGHLNQRSRNTAAVEQIPRMYHNVNFMTKSTVKRGFEVGEEIWASPTPLDPGTKGQVEAQMGIRNEQDARDLATQIPLPPVQIGSLWNWIRTLLLVRITLVRIVGAAQRSVEEIPTTQNQRGRTQIV